MTLYFTDQDAVERIARQFLGGTLPKSEWTHAAHFAVALWLMRNRPETPITERLPELIRAYNVCTGTANTDTSGYHETITLASIRAARSWLSRQPASRRLHKVVDGLMRTRFGRSDWPLDHWSEARLFSAQARRTWVEPDLAPFTL